MLHEILLNFAAEKVDRAKAVFPHGSSQSGCLVLSIRSNPRKGNLSAMQATELLLLQYIILFLYLS